MGFLAGMVRKKRGLKLDSEKKNRERVYRIPASQTSADAAAQPS